MWRVLLGAAGALCAAAAGGCGGEDEPASISQGPGGYRSPSRVPNLRCERAVGVLDAAGDARAAARGQQRRAPAYGDLRRFELMADKDGVCARWTTAAPAPRGTAFDFNVYGPPYRHRRLDVVVLQGHGVRVSVTRHGLRVSDAGGGARLRAEASRSGRMVSVYIPRAELDRRPRDLPDRRPFPYGAFAFDARVFAPQDTPGRWTMDVWPQDNEGQAGWISGRMCLPDCEERRAIGSATKYQPDAAPRRDAAD